MRFFFALSFVSFLGCPAPVSETPDRDGGIHLIDAGCPERCPAGQELCGCECVRLTSDHDNCGACGAACDSATADNSIGWTCLDGQCSCSTDEVSLCEGTVGSTCCNDRNGVGCFDLTSALDHCGSCTTTCNQFILHPDTKADPPEHNPGVSDHCEDSLCVCGDLGRACLGSLSSTCCMDDVGGVADPSTARCADLLSGGTDEVDGEDDCGDCNIKCPADPLAPNGDHCRSGQCVCGPGTPEVPATECPAGQVCCGTGKAAACAPAGSCG
jgi:hypothetical protein